MPTTSVAKISGTISDLIMRRKIVDSGLSVDGEVGREPPEEHADDHRDDDPLRQRDATDELTMDFRRVGLRSSVGERADEPHLIETTSRARQQGLRRRTRCRRSVECL